MKSECAMLKVLEYLQKAKTLKMTFSLGQSFAIELKKKHNMFLTKIMLLNEIQAFFISLRFLALIFSKSNWITFRFSLSLTSYHTNYQTIKFPRLNLQNSKRSEK